MSNSSESLPRFNRLKRRHELALREAGRGGPLFSDRGRLGALSVYDDVAIVSGPKTTSRVELDRLAGVDYERTLMPPWFGMYRLTFVYIDEGGKRQMASVTMGYGRAIQAIAVLKSLATQRQVQMVVRKEPYPLEEALAAAAFLPAGLVIAGIRGGAAAGSVVLALMLFFCIVVTEAIVEWPHHPFNSGVQD